MKGKLFLVVLWFALVAGLSTDGVAAQEATASVLDDVGPAFTYQGYLENGSGPVEGACDFQFGLWNLADGGQQSGSIQTLIAVPMAAGRFTVVLNDANQFGTSPFDGQARWLAISVRCPSGSGGYVPLDPRQQLMVTPYSAYSTAAPWSGLRDLPAGFADDVDDDTLSQLNCADGEIPEWSGIQWICGMDDVSSGGGGGDITAVHAGTGLSGGGVSGDVTLTADTSYLQHRVASSCPAGSSIRLINQDGTVSCETDDDGGGDVTAVIAGTGLSGGGDAGDLNLAILGSYQLPQSCNNGQIPEWDGIQWNCGADDVGSGNGGGDVTAVYAGDGLSGGGDAGDLTLSANTAYVQRRVSAACTAGSSIQSIGQDGSVVCETDDDSGGDVTAVDAGTGLSGGGVSGHLTLSADTAFLQRRVSTTCAAGSSIRSISQDGSVVCETDDDSGGDVTAVQAGTGLFGGGDSGDLTLSANTAYLQRRVSGTCPAGSSIRTISNEGSVQCEADDLNAYSAGIGLNLINNQFSADFSGSGSASQVAHSDHYHLGQTWTGNNNPLTIEGSFSTTDNDATLILSNTSGDGLLVKSAKYGISVDHASLDGLSVFNADRDGINIWKSGDDGLYVHYAGNAFGAVYQPSVSNGVEIASATGNGMFVGQVDKNGLDVWYAGEDGILVEAAFDDGLSIGTATRTVGDDGIFVENATDDGLQIGSIEFPDYGVYIPSPGVTSIALWANTADASGEWGLYTSDKIYASNVSLSSLTLVAKVDIDSQLAPGEVVAASGVADPLPDSLALLPLVRPADSYLWNGVIGVVESRLAFQPAPGKEEENALTLTSVPGLARAGDYVALTVLGVAEVKVDSTAGVIEPGQQLTISQASGRVRALQTRTLEGMVVTEGSPVIGIALATLEPGIETIPVFLTLR